MTIQEFVKKESENSYAYVGFGDAQYNYSLGLTKGLEIAGEFAEWGQRNKYKQSGGKKGNGEWYRQSAGYGGGEPTFYTTSELIEIFITEKYKQ